MLRDSARLLTLALLAAVLVLPGRAAGQDYSQPAFPKLSLDFLMPANWQEKDKDDSKDKENGKEKENGKNGDDKDKDKDDDKEKRFSIHGQATVVSQGNWPFPSPYAGPNSLQSILNYRTTMTGTLFLGAKVWEGGAVFFNPEIAGGTGLSGTLGIGGFPNGEATRVGQIAPTPYIARLFFRQTIGLGGETEKVEDAPNQIAGERDSHRLTFTIGKVPAPDFFDNNTYSHDPRTQFLNWALMYNSAWDYPANVRGYDYGGCLELDMKTWAIRYGIFGEPTEANGAEIDPHFLRANAQALEFERRYEVNDHPGKIRLLSYLNNAHMGNYRVALRDMPVQPDITTTRAYRVKYGFGVNWEQEITKELGVFGRLGWNDDHTESWAFTEIGATAAIGMLLKGKCWSRPQDQVGLAYVCNDLSNGHRRYLEAGGLGFILGDGHLTYGTENILEGYYNWELRKGIYVTFDVQGVANPGYNRDRGPVAIAAIRVHMEF